MKIRSKENSKENLQSLSLKKDKERILAIKLKKILLLVMVLMTLSSTVFSNTSNASLINRIIPLHARGTYSGLMRFGDIGIQTTIVVHVVDGIEFPAYCIQRLLPRSGNWRIFSNYP